MSYEGYVQYWCENGHYHTVDAYDDYSDGYEFKCPECFGKQAFRNSVDLTNGSYYEDPGGAFERIDGYIEPVVVEKAPMCTCNSCGHTHATGPVVYVIPESKD